jgi:hypothetical protein
MAAQPNPKDQEKDKKTKLLAQDSDAQADHDVEGKPKVNVATFRGIPQKLHESLKALAKELGIAPGELARYFLEEGLSRVESKADRITPEFVPGGYTLYPEERRARVRQRSGRRARAHQKPHSYYGVPREVVRTVLEQSREIGVTQGELARRFFENGIERYRAGELELAPVPVEQIATLYPEDLK